MRHKTRFLTVLNTLVPTKNYLNFALKGFFISLPAFLVIAVGLKMAVGMTGVELLNAALLTTISFYVLVNSYFLARAFTLTRDINSPLNELPHEIDSSYLDWDHGDLIELADREAASYFTFRGFTDKGALVCEYNDMSNADGFVTPNKLIDGTEINHEPRMISFSPKFFNELNYVNTSLSNRNRADHYEQLEGEINKSQYREFIEEFKSAYDEQISDTRELVAS